MKWIIRIEGDINLRIVVNFSPLDESLIFSGHFKPFNKDWIEFTAEKYSMNIELDKIQDLLFKTFEILKRRVEIFKSLDEGFQHIKLIEIVKD